MSDIKKLKLLDSNIKKFDGILSLLSFDQETLMPKEALDERAEYISLIALKHHELFSSDELYDLLISLKSRDNYKKLSLLNKAYVNNFFEEVEKKRKIPSSFVEEFSKLQGKSFGVWEKAKLEDDYDSFKPYLEKLVDYSKRKAAFINPDIDPYDVLLQEFEKGLSVEKLDEVFIPLKEELVSLLSKVKKSSLYGKEKFLPSVDLNAQKEISLKIASLILGDKKNWVLSESEHPFSTTISPNDIRITTKYSDDPFFSLTSTAHEAGHGLYEMNLGKNLRGTFLHQAAGLGVHESQSRFWENHVVKSKSFWSNFYDDYAKICNLDLSKEDFYLSLNRVQPSFIRIKADELTYGLHVIIRYELERDLINGKLSVENLKDAWNKKYEEYLGVKVEKDSDGILQDVHWSHAYFGYFPTYLIGSIYSALIYDTLCSKNDNIDKEISNLDFSFIRTWLKHNIHSHGSTLGPEELIKYACGEGLTYKNYVEYLNKKYKELYDL